MVMKRYKRSVQKCWSCLLSMVTEWLLCCPLGVLLSLLVQIGPFIITCDVYTMDQTLELATLKFVRFNLLAIY